LGSSVTHSINADWLSRHLAGWTVTDSVNPDEFHSTRWLARR
jgi:hypothetical protein